MQRVLVQELKCPGHCVPFAIDNVALLGSAGARVRLVLNGAVRAHVEENFSATLEKHEVDVHYIDPREFKYNSAETAAFEVDSARAHIDEWSPDRIILPTGDAVLRWLVDDSARQSVVLDGSLRWELMVHSLPASVPGIAPRPFMRWFISRRALDHFAGARILTPDPYSVIGPGRRWLSRRARASIGLLPYTPPVLGDPVSRLEARRRLGLPEEGRLLVVPGAIDPRKAIVRLLKARPALEGILDGIVFAGPMAEVLKPIVKEARQGPGPTVHVIDRYLPGNDFLLPFHAADVIWAVYPRWRGIASVQFVSALLDRTCLVDVLHPSATWIAKGTTGCVTLRGSIPQAIIKALESSGPSAGYVTWIRTLTAEAPRRAVLLDGARISSEEELEAFVSGGAGLPRVSSGQEP